MPDADLAAVRGGYLPALRDRLSIDVDPALELPETAPPVLVCRVEFGDGSDGALVVPLPGGREAARSWG